MAEPPRPWAETREGVRLVVRLTPRAGRERLGGVAEIDGRTVLRAAVTAPPVGGVANAALRRLVAKSLGVAKSAVVIAAGESARVKTLTVSGEAAALSARLAALAEARA